MDTLIEIRGLTKQFGPVKAVQDISFSVNRGEVLGFLGPNGAGKSTAMKMLSGYYRPTRGGASICGFDIVTQATEVQKRLGYLPEGAPLYGDLSVLGLLRFAADIRGYRGADRRRRVDRAVELVELSTVLQRPVETLSKGFKRRVGLAQALLHDPEVLILDEPTDGLDPNQKHQVRILLQQMAGDKAIIISTHILEEVDAVCTRAVVISRGRLVADAKPAELEERSRYHNAVLLRVQIEAAEKVQGALSGLAYVADVERFGDANGSTQLLALPAGGTDILEAVRATASKEGVAVDQIYVERGRLDDVFRQLTAGS